MTLPSDYNLAVEVAFDDNAFATSPTWTDVTGDVVDVRIERGRDSLLDHFSAGTATVAATRRAVMSGTALGRRRGEGGGPLSKRLDSVSVRQFRKKGYLPQALANYIALLGWSPGDNAAQHDVYFGTDKDAVDNADASDTNGALQLIKLDPEGTSDASMGLYRIADHQLGHLDS